jgi:hypothetical protein
MIHKIDHKRTYLLLTGSPFLASRHENLPRKRWTGGSKQDKEAAQKMTGASEGHLWRGFPIFIFGEEALRFYYMPYPFGLLWTFPSYRPFLFLFLGKAAQQTIDSCISNSTDHNFNSAP